ncbi:MAG: endo-1,4-beta-xylanase [Treponema sp.]|nr:endo-1,4-beta-xylanase [Treponema sp.]
MKVHQSFKITITAAFFAAVFIFAAAGCQSNTKGTVVKENPLYTELACDVPSLAEKYRDLFLVGSTSFIDESYYYRHVNVTTPENELKPGPVHPRSPAFLNDTGAGYGQFFEDFKPDPQNPEWNFAPADSRLGPARGRNINFHGHTLAWNSQSPQWMVNIVPDDPAGGSFAGYNFTNGNFITRGRNPSPSNSAAGNIQISKETARRIYYDHIFRAMRHYSSDDVRYAGSRLDNTDTGGKFEFLSWDVLNEEINDTHSSIIPVFPDEWRKVLRHTSWLRAMTGDDYGETMQHYVYLLFKYAHIAVPNAKMADAFKTNYADFPDYLKQDSHDDGGSIDRYIAGKPPVLYYNDYGLNSPTKAKAAYNMIAELNTLWKTDPLYDNRNLIEGIGLQAHYTVSNTLEKEVRASLELFRDLMDRGLLTTIAVSELDLVCGPAAPGGMVIGGNLPSRTQADAVGYQYALLYRLFAEFSPYIQRVTTWGLAEPGWNSHLLLFRSINGNVYAAPGYYGAYDPDIFISGHSYLDDYFKPTALQGKSPLP